MLPQDATPSDTLPLGLLSAILAAGKPCELRRSLWAEASESADAAGATAGEEGML